MVGTTSFSKLNTKQDFSNNYNFRTANNASDPLQDYRKLYENRLNWFTQTIEEEQQIEDPITHEMITQIVQVPVVVDSVEVGITDDTHRVIVEGTEETPIFYQQELVLDPNALMFLKGFTVEELETILGI